MNDIRKSARKSQKAESRDRIVKAAARRLRREGVAGSAVADVMADAGLTHGGFYVHFSDKAALANAALGEALDSGRDDWFRGLDRVGGRELARWLAGRYLNDWHLNNIDEGCAFGALATDMRRAAPPLRRRFREGLERSLTAITGGLARGSGASDRGASERALAFLALCVGAIQLARAVDDSALAARILGVCRQAGVDLAAPENSATHDKRTAS